MAFLVDGNNVMGQTPGWHRDKPGSRRRLLGELATLASAERARITVVFDGAPEDGIPDGAVFRGVKVYFPDRGADADSLILEILASSRDRRGITVVTSDRQLAAECRETGAKVVRSGDFRRRLEAASRAASSAVGDPGAADRPTEGTLDDWMRYFGHDPDSE